MLRTLSAASMLAVVALTGCGLGTPATSTPEVQHLNLTGSVHGGQQPVSGARIYIFQANNTGYGNKSVDLFGKYPVGALLPVDSTLNAHYTTTDAAGAFSITGEYTCNGSGPVYLLATQGNPASAPARTTPPLQSSPWWPIPAAIQLSCPPPCRSASLKSRPSPASTPSPAT